MLLSKKRQQAKREIQKALDTLINGWILKLRKQPLTTHLDDTHWGTYYWNEREFQWALFSHIRYYAWREGFGSEFAVHAEVPIDRPRYSRKKWNRLDIAIIDHAAYRRWRKEKGGYGKFIETHGFEAAIEFKLTWDHGDSTRTLVKDDILKLDHVVRDGIAKCGYLVWFDQVGSNGPRKDLPFFSCEEVQELRANRLARIVHWPDGEVPVCEREDIKKAKPGFYPERA